VIKKIRRLIYKDSYEEGYVEVPQGGENRSISLDGNEKIHIEQEVILRNKNKYFKHN